MRLAFSEISSGYGQSHCEITGSLPHLDELVARAAHISAAELDTLLDQVTADVNIIASFCTQITGQPEV